MQQLEAYRKLQRERYIKQQEDESDDIESPQDQKQTINEHQNHEESKLSDHLQPQENISDQQQPFLQKDHIVNEHINVKNEMIQNDFDNKLVDDFDYQIRPPDQQQEQQLLGDDMNDISSVRYQQFLYQQQIALQSIQMDKIKREREKQLLNAKLTVQSSKTQKPATLQQQNKKSIDKTINQISSTSRSIEEIKEESKQQRNGINEKKEDANNKMNQNKLEKKEEAQTIMEKSSNIEGSSENDRLLSDVNDQRINQQLQQRIDNIKKKEQEKSDEGDTYMTGIVFAGVVFTVILVILLLFLIFK